MISRETQAQLANLIMTIATKERAIEDIRQKLSKIDLFSPYSAFLRIDRKRKHAIDKTDLKNFLL
jgi:hypothetical protein